jgi:hypothetical protein
MPEQIYPKVKKKNVRVMLAFLKVKKAMIIKKN